MNSFLSNFMTATLCILAFALMVAVVLVGGVAATESLAPDNTPNVEPAPENMVYMPLVLTKIGPVFQDMIEIPAGAFQMGCDPSASFCDQNEPPIRSVTLPRFSIDKFEVTWERYSACIAAGECTSVSPEPSTPKHPVSFVTHEQATTFCEWDGKRLPSEAEWEKAARGSDGRIYPWGAETPTCELANHTSATSGFACVFGGSPVGTYPDGASPFGVMDLAGNLSEYTSTVGEFPGGLGTGFVVKGGNFMSFPGSLRSSALSLSVATQTNIAIGFRCVLP